MHKLPDTTRKLIIIFECCTYIRRKTIRFSVFDIRPEKRKSCPLILEFKTNEIAPEKIYTFLRLYGVVVDKNFKKKIKQALNNMYKSIIQKIQYG